MAVSPKDKKLGTLILVTVIGLIIGAYFSLLISMIPGGPNVVKTFFTQSVGFSIGYPNPASFDIYAIKFQGGLGLRFNFMSLVGVGVALYLYRWYR